jgi:PmbA protein
LDLAQSIADIARKKGASEARAAAESSRNVEIVWREGKIEKVSEATTRGAGLRLYVDGRYSAVWTSDLRPAALERFVERSVAMARALAKDPFRQLPDPKLYPVGAAPDLQLSDPRYESWTADARRKLAKEMEDAARSVPNADRIVSVSASVSDTLTTYAMVATNGFAGEKDTTHFSVETSVTCRDADGRRPEDWHYAGAKFLADLPTAAEVGKAAAERALGTLGAKKAASAVLPLVVENRAARRLVSALLGPLSGRALQQKQSFLDGMIGKTLGGKLLSITDDPTIKKGFGSRWFDAEGMAAKKFPVIEAGVLASYYIDDYYGRKLKMAPTTDGPSNLVFALGSKPLAGLIADIKDGVLLTSFLGGNSNDTTGDYSLGFQGYRISSGAKAEPIAEMNISGNQRDLWGKLIAVGSDPWPYSSVATPTLVFDGAQIAGL